MVGIVATIMIATYVDDPPNQKRAAKVDYMGIALLIGAVGIILLAGALAIMDNSITAQASVIHCYCLFVISSPQRPGVT